jgi:phage/plasmid-like protein (TIGR03299 family)
MRQVKEKEAVMPAEVESGFYNGEFGVPWHNLGERVEGAQSAQEALTLARLDFEVEMQPIYLADGSTVENFRASVRSTDGKALGVLGNRYVPAQNVEVLSFLDSLIGEGQAVYDSAWSLRGGRTVALSARLTDMVQMPEGEEVETYLTATTTHDGKGQIRFIVSPIRVVCMNTLNLATDNARFVWARKHTRFALSDENLELAREALELATVYQTWLGETARTLIDQTFTANAFEQLARQLFLRDEELWDAELPNGLRGDNVEALVTLWNDSDNLDNIRGTKWGALNAVAEFADYRTRYVGANAEDNRAVGVLVGRSSELKTRAYDLLVA